MTDSPIGDLTRATTIGNNDLFVLEQGGQAKALSGQTFVAKLTAIADGHGGIASIEKTRSAGVEDTYTITFADGDTFTYTVTNGDSIDRIVTETQPSMSTTHAYDVYVSIFMKSDPLNPISNFTIPGGNTGLQGVGQKVYIMYSEVEPTQDSDMTNIPSAWMGIAVTTNNSAPSHYTSYTWNYIKGEQGEQGIQGLTGAFIWRSDVGPTILGSTTFFVRTDVYGPLTGAGFQEDPVYGDLLIWGGTYYSVSRVTMNATYGKVVEVTNPYTIIGNGLPAGGTTGQVLKKSSNSDFAVEWGTGGGGGSDKVYWATYGTTSRADIIAAKTAGKIVMCEYNDGDDNISLFRLVNITDDGYCYFESNSTGLNEMERIEVDDQSNWMHSKWTAPTLQLTGTPSALGTAARGTAATASRADHVHPMPTAANVGAVAVAQGVAHAGEFVVVGSDGNITTMAMSAWQGGNY